MLESEWQQAHSNLGEVEFISLCGSISPHSVVLASLDLGPQTHVTQVSSSPLVLTFCGVGIILQRQNSTVMMLDQDARPGEKRNPSFLKVEEKVLVHLIAFDQVMCLSLNQS